MQRREEPRGQSPAGQQGQYRMTLYALHIKYNMSAPESPLMCDWMMKRQERGDRSPLGRAARGLRDAPPHSGEAPPPTHEARMHVAPPFPEHGVHRGGDSPCWVEKLANTRSARRSHPQRCWKAMLTADTLDAT